HIRENYVLPEKGEEISEYFLKDLKKGRFYQATTLKKLDSIMTRSLRDASNDYHLFTWNNKEIVQQLKGDNEEEEESASVGFFNDQKAYDSNFGFAKVVVLEENIGYIKLSQINISEHSLKKLYGAMTLVEHTQALIIDLRGNSGGGSTVGPVLETFFFEKHTDLLEFKERNGKTEMSSTVPWLLEKRYLKSLYLLVDKGTASAAEAFAYALKHQNRCIIVGEPTSGGAYMNAYFPVNEEFIVAISTAAPFLPGTTESWEGKGVQPHHMAEKEKALTKAIDLIKAP
ncbi:MAG: S41 family peptidase, partial [Bacteroidota bacterium]